MPSDFVFPYIGKVEVRLSLDRHFFMWSDGSDTIGCRLKQGGLLYYEPEVQPVFSHLVSKSKIFIDIGANTGFFSLLGAAINPSCKTYALEPFPAAAKALERNVEANREACNVFVHKIAASNINRQGAFYVPKAIRISTGGSELRSESEECVEVPCTFIRLDDFVAAESLTHIDLLKIDTEYTEPKVIEGAIASIKKFRPPILVEILNDLQARQIQNLLAEHSYVFYQMRPSGLRILENLELGNSRDTNCNFLLYPQERILEGFLMEPSKIDA